MKCVLFGLHRLITCSCMWSSLQSYSDITEVLQGGSLGKGDGEQLSIIMLPVQAAQQAA